MSADLLGSVLGTAAASGASGGSGSGSGGGGGGGGDGSGAAIPASPVRFGGRGIGRHKRAEPDDVILQIEMGAAGGAADTAGDGGADENGGGGAGGGKDAVMGAFFADVAATKALLARIGRALRSLNAMHAESKAATRVDDMRELREKMQAETEATTKAAHEAKTRLEALSKSNDEACETVEGCEAGSSADRTRRSVTASLSKKLRDLMGEFSELRETLQSDYREVVERRVFTVTGERPSEEAVEEMIESGESEQIFQRAILEQGRGQVLDTVAEIQERHEAVREMEKGLLELHSVFMDMAVLVEAQGEMLDNIASQVHKSVEYVKKGTTALQQAKEYQKKSRKWACCAIILLLMIIVVTVVAVLKPWETGDSRGGDQ
eukprot:PRCOL_00003303-RA